MTKDHIEQIAEEVAKVTVRETLTQLGVDVSRPFDVQADHLYLRKQRLAYEQMGNMTKRAAVTILVAGFISMLVLGFKDWIKLP